MTKKRKRERSAVLAHAIASSQNPLVSGYALFDFCRRRFRRFGLEASFVSWLDQAERTGHLFPAYVQNQTPYYSTFQAWQIWYMAGVRKFTEKLERPPLMGDFDRLLPLLADIQDYYLPLVRGDQRLGVWYDYHQNIAGISGSWFNTTTSYILDNLRRLKARDIEEGHFEPARLLEKSGLTAEELREWICRLIGNAEHIDPLRDWRLLVRFVSYSQKQKLRYDALLAQDFLELAEMLRLFYVDASEEPIFEDVMERRQPWIREYYGDSVDRPCELCTGSP